ncbi:MAG: Ribonuclease HII [bacterium ADurb.Bin212]|nr:MAG: Ribonuclease HII [bacterium ADurb.Bin212]
MYTNFDYEKELISQGYKLIAGVDEVGRGALAGPLLSCAVILDAAKDFDGLAEIRDSKKISSKKRERLSAIIKKECIDFSFGVVSAREIDNLGISSANGLSFERALQGLKKVDYALVDGRDLFDLWLPHRCVVGGDNISTSIAVASILAKVERDGIMAGLPNCSIYHFDKHAGYGTKLHFEMINKHGVSDQHRKSFLKNLSNIK